MGKPNGSVFCGLDKICAQDGATMNIWKRALCSFLTVTMLFSSMPFYAFADAIDEENGTSDEYVVEPGPEEENALAVSDDGAVDMETFLAEDVPDETIAAYSIEDCTPSIEINAQNVICEQDEYVELSVIATVTNLGECTYQWYEIIDDTFCLIEGENSPQYSPSTSAPGIRYYYCEVTNRVDAQQYQASSSTCAITVKEQPEDYIAMQDSVDDEVGYTPSITTQPASANCAQGDDVTLSVTATAVEGGVLSYQWYEVSGETKTAIDGATEASYKPSTAEAGEKNYFCEVTNTYKSKTYTATSETVTVSVEAQKIELIKNIQILATNYSTNPSDNLDVLDGKFDRSQTEYEGITVTDAGFKVYLWPNEEVQSKINYTIFYNDVAGTGVADSNSISVGTSGVPVPFSFNGAILSQNRETKVDIQLSTTDSNGNVTSETYTFHVTFLRGLQTLQAKAGGSRLTLTPSTPLQNNALVNEFQGEIAKGLESVSLKIRAQSSEAAVYVGGKAFTSSSFADVSLAEYITEAGDYAIIPIQLKWPVSNPTQTREYTLKLKLVDYTPSITTQPASANCAQGDDVTLSVTATAVEGGVLSYQWYEVSGETKTAIDGATEASYKPSTAEAGEKNYFCEVTNTYKSKTYTATSETAIVTVWSVNPPQFTLQPEDITCNVNDPASLFVEISAPEAGTARLQWFRDGNFLTMGDFIKVDTSKVGKFTYYCVISWELNGKYYKIKSETAVVTVTDEPLASKNPTPHITVNPQSVTCDKDDTPELSVEYEIDESVLGEITYQWYIGSANVLIPGATGKTYTPETYSNRTKSYYCRITNTYNGRKYTVQSDAARVYVNLTYISDLEIQRDFGSYAKSAPKANDILEYKTEYDAGDVPEYIYMVFRYVDRGIDFKFDVYHNTENSIDGAERVESAVVEPISTVESEGTKIATAYEYYASINAGFDEGVHYLFCKVTAYVPGDDSVKPVTLLMGPVKLTYKEANIGFDGTGSAEDPYKLKTPEDLTRLEELVAQGKSFAGRHFQVVNDITLPDGWTPIGCTKDGGTNINNGANLNAFSGTIDGKMDNGENAKITVPAGGLPLLGYINGATVRNLNIYGERIAGAGLVNNYTGAGLSGNAITIENVKLLSGSQTLKSGLIASCGGNAYACASAGFVVTIRDCVIESGVIVGYEGNESQIGSFAGRINGTIENCTSSATVKGGSYVGGILGSRDNAMAQCVVKNSTFHGTVESSGSYAGGIVGGGYDNQTAPNGACPTIVACTVDGIVRGNERVGGIFGGDGFVAQTWDNVVGSISANSFTGKVSGNKYVGAIIGYRDSLNRYDNIAGNTYSAGCGADKGIGYVKYLDTSYANPTKMDGTIVFNTANGTSDCPTVEGCAWKSNHNRTDDPLGADADKLCRVAGGSTEPICYELTASGTYKTEYTVGDELDLTGIVLTASWSNGTTTDVALSDVTVEGYDQNKVGIQTITLKYGDAVAYITVTVKPESVKITVSVSILGDEKHGAVDEPHGLARGGLTAWAEDTSVEADTTETVWDVLQRVAKSKDIELDAFYSEQYGTYYIRGVNGLSEKDNGENSGWMYTVNGKHPEVGVSARFVNENDQIILHYTDDYTYEEDGENYGKEPPVTPKPDKTNATELLSGKSTTLKVLGKNGKVLGKNDITWTLKDPQDSIYATISATGTVKAKTVLTKHDVTFVGTLKGSYEGTVEQVVTILPKVTQVEIVKDGENVTGKTLSLNAVEEETLTLTAKVYPDELAQEVTWKSSNTKIAQIDAEGTVSFAGKTGTVTVTATSTDGSRISATVKLQVGVLTKSVTIAEPADYTLRSGKSLTLKATTDPVKPTVSGVTFKLVNASDSAYVSVSTSGKVSAKTVNEPHVVKIYAVSKDAAAVESNVITLTILPKNVQSLILKSGDKYVTNGKVVRNVNEELTLKAYTLDTTDGAVEETRDVTWTSSNTKVATIDETGKVTCVKTGTVRLTATADKKTKAAVTLKVTNLVNGITIVTKNDKDAMVVASGKSLALKATVQPANASQKAVTWSMVSGSRYAKISSSGVVSANKGLTSPVTVTVKAVAKDGSGMEATQEITINPVALGVTISDVNHERTTGTLVWNMTEADNIQFSANVYPVKAVQAVTWKSSNAKIAAVDGTGKVTCYKAGTVTITATAKDGSGKKASFKLNIIKKLKSLTLEDQTVEGGKSLQLKAILDPVDPTNKKLTWTVSSNNVGAKISSSGKLTTKKVTKNTKVMVTVSSNDGTGLTATCFVTITPSVKK